MHIISLVYASFLHPPPPYMKMFTLVKSDLVRAWRDFQFHILNQLRWITTWALWFFEANSFFLPGYGVVSGFVERLWFIPSLCCVSPVLLPATTP